MAAETAGLLMEGQGEDPRAAIKMAAKIGEGAMTEARVEMEERDPRNPPAPTVLMGARRQTKRTPASSHLTAGSRSRKSRPPMEVLRKASG